MQCVLSSRGLTACIHTNLPAPPTARSPGDGCEYVNVSTGPYSPRGPYSCRIHCCIHFWGEYSINTLYQVLLPLYSTPRSGTASVCWKNNRAGCSSTLESKRSFFSRNETYVRKPYVVIIQRSNVAMNNRMLLNNVCS